MASTFSSYSGSDTHIRIDSSVTSIPDEAFIRNDKLVEVELPDSIRAIGNDAFAGCSSLKRIHLCEGLRTIGKRAFHSCTSLSQVDIPSTVTTIDSLAFIRCTSLETVHLRDGLQTIGSQAFDHCKTLIQMNIPSTVITIDSSAFGSCTSLKTVHLRDGLQTIGGGAFYRCKTLSQVNIPSTVSTIDDSAFGRCTSLKEVQFYDGLCAIDIRAFCNCLSLMRINIPSNVIFMDGPGPFQLCPILRNVVIPPSSTLGDEEFLWLFPKFQDVDCTFDMLKSRFDNLPLHKLCYNHSHQLMESNNRGMLADFLKSDCLGMTPLHVLACSGMHDLGLFRRIIEICPNSLFAEDKWGGTPFGYVILSGAPKEVIHCFLETHRRCGMTPIGFIDVIKRLAVFASGEHLRRVIHAQRTYFPDLMVDWESIGEEILHELRRQDRVTFEDVEYFIIKFQGVWILLEASVSRRSVCMSLEHQVEIDTAICERVGLHYAYDYEYIRQKVIDFARQHHNKLVGGTTILELALWKMKLNEASELNPNIMLDGQEVRKQCRSDIGKVCNVVIPNVLSFL
ncbi:hypothetical protein ACHAXH_002685 [Discostella pseudostelligera]